MNKLKEGWYKITKIYRNATDVWALKVTKKIKEKYYDEETLCDNIAENTPGGENYGCDMKIEYFGKVKPENTDYLFLKPVMTLQWRIKNGEYFENRKKERDKIMEKCKI